MPIVVIVVLPLMVICGLKGKWGAIALGVIGVLVLVPIGFVAGVATMDPDSSLCHRQQS